jgi:hypothetical protein
MCSERDAVAGRQTATREESVCCGGVELLSSFPSESTSLDIIAQAPIAPMAKPRHRPSTQTATLLRRVFSLHARDSVNSPAELDSFDTLFHSTTVALLPIVGASIWVVPSFLRHVTDCEGSLFVATMPVSNIWQATSAFVCTVRIRTPCLGLHNIVYVPALRRNTTLELTVQPKSKPLAD